MQNHLSLIGLIAEVTRNLSLNPANAFGARNKLPGAAVPYGYKRALLRHFITALLYRAVSHFYFFSLLVQWPWSERCWL